MKTLEFSLNGKTHSVTKEQTNKNLQLFWGSLSKPKLMAEGNDEEELKTNVLEFAYDYRSQLLSEKVISYSEGFEFEDEINEETLYDEKFTRYVNEHSAWDIASDIVDGDLQFVDWMEVN